LAVSCVVFSSAPPSFGIAGDTRPERIADTAPPRESALHPPEPKLVHYFVLRRRQFSWLAIFNPDHVPSCTLRHGAFGRLDQSLMGMAAAPMTPTVRPGCFIVDVEKSEAHAQRGQYFREQRVGSRRHARDIPKIIPWLGFYYVGADSAACALGRLRQAFGIIALAVEQESELATVI
jgi:hypothetical protein